MNDLNLPQSEILAEVKNDTKPKKLNIKSDKKPKSKKSKKDLILRNINSCEKVLKELQQCGVQLRSS